MEAPTITAAKWTDTKSVPITFRLRHTLRGFNMALDTGFNVVTGAQMTEMEKKETARVAAVFDREVKRRTEDKQFWTELRHIGTPEVDKLGELKSLDASEKFYAEHRAKETIAALFGGPQHITQVLIDEFMGWDAVWVKAQRDSRTRWLRAGLAAESVKPQWLQEGSVLSFNEIDRLYDLGGDPLLADVEYEIKTWQTLRWDLGEV